MTYNKPSKHAVHAVTGIAGPSSEDVNHCIGIALIGNGLPVREVNDGIGRCNMGINRQRSNNSLVVYF